MDAFSDFVLNCSRTEMSEKRHILFEQINGDTVCFMIYRHGHEIWNLRSGESLLVTNKHSNCYFFWLKMDVPLGWQPIGSYPQRFEKKQRL